jgi:hypothetical protein
MDESDNEANERQARKIPIPKPVISHPPPIATVNTVNEA